MFRTTFFALCLASVTSIACGQEPLPIGEDAIPEAAPTQVAPVVQPTTDDACADSLTDGQSALITSAGCTVVVPGVPVTFAYDTDHTHITSTGVVKPGPKVLRAWVGPHAMFCFGPTADAPDVCAGNSAPGAVPAPKTTADELTYTSVVYQH